MNRYNHLRQKAISLREMGASLSEIVNKLVVPKTTAYYWIKNIKLRQVSNNAKKAGLANKIKYQKIREEIYKSTFCNAENLLSEDLFLRDFVLLYMTEGYRRDRNQVAICNSSVEIMKLANIFMMKMAKNKISYVLRVHLDQDVEMVKDFWSKNLLIPSSNIKVLYKQNSSQLRQRNWRCVNGVLTILSSDTAMRTRLQALMDCVKMQWSKQDKTCS